MADIEKVIQGLECRAFDNDFPCHQCAYFKKDDNYAVPRCDFRGLLDDAAKLLKEYKQQDGCPCTHCMEWECEEVCEEYKKWKNS